MERPTKRWLRLAAMAGAAGISCAAVIGSTAVGAPKGGGSGGPKLAVNFQNVLPTVGESDGTAAVIIQRNGDLSGALTVTCSTVASGSTATNGSDYTATVDSVEFQPTQKFSPCQIPLVGDDADEANETVNLLLTGPGVAKKTTATLTIVDDDPAGDISVGDATVDEGGNLEFLVTLVENPAGRATAASVSYATGDGSASAPGDYSTTAGTLTFAPGETSKTVTVPTTEDESGEGPENLTLTLSSPVNADLDDETGEGTINDDDYLIVIDPTTASIPAGGSYSHVTTVTRNGAPVDANLTYEVWRDNDNNDLYDRIARAGETTGPDGVFAGAYPGPTSAAEDVVLACVVDVAGDPCGLSTDTDLYLPDSGDETIGEDTTLAADTSDQIAQANVAWT
jgi:hypothetical protein